jgi:N-dimethylarginine dimethylaminohydrolase
MAAADVDLVEMRDAAVARGHGDVLELDIHIILGCEGERDTISKLGVLERLGKGAVSDAPSRSFPL